MFYKSQITLSYIYPGTDYGYVWSDYILLEVVTVVYYTIRLHAVNESFTHPRAAGRAAVPGLQRQQWGEEKKVRYGDVEI